MVDIVRQDSTTKTQEYFFPIGEDKWEIDYSIFTYPSELDKPRGVVDESLLIEIIYPDEFGGFKDSTKSFWEGIYLGNGEISLRFGSDLGISPALGKCNKWGDDVREEVLDSLSNEARSLLERGLEKYEEIRVDK